MQFKAQVLRDPSRRVALMPFPSAMVVSRNMKPVCIEKGQEKRGLETTDHDIVLCYMRGYNGIGPFILQQLNKNGRKVQPLGGFRRYRVEALNLLDLFVFQLAAQELMFLEQMQPVCCRRLGPLRHRSCSRHTTRDHKLEDQNIPPLNSGT